MAVPTVTSLFPATGPSGIDIVVTGTGFDLDVTNVTFTGYDAGPNFTVVSDTQLIVTVPAGTGTVNVRVTNVDGQSADTAADNFVYAAVEGGNSNLPTVTSLVPTTSTKAYGQGGDSVVIGGTGFITTKFVFFGSIRCIDFTVDSDTQITAIAPPGPIGAVAVSVENAYGVSTTTTNFNYPAFTQPLLTNISPTTAYDEASITLTGTNFLGADGTEQVSEVLFYNGIPAADFRTISTTTIIAIVPPGTSTGVVTIVSLDGTTDTSASSFVPKGTVGAGIDGALSTANGKNTASYSTSAPNVNNANVAGDLWYQYTTGGTVTHMFIGGGGSAGAYVWTEMALQDTILGNLTAGKITTGTLTGITIEAVTFRTAESPARRIEMVNSPADTINFYSAVSGEDSPGSISVLDFAGDEGMLEINSPQLNINANGVPTISMRQGSDTKGNIRIWPGDLLELACVTDISEQLPSKDHAIWDEIDFMNATTAWVYDAVIGRSFTASKFGGTTPSASSLNVAGHPGVIAFTTGSTALHGHQTVTNIIAIQAFAVGDFCEFLFRLPYLTNTAQNIRMGFMNANSDTEPTAGAWMKMENNVGAGAHRIHARVRYGSTTYTGSTLITPDVSSWYRLRIEINASGYPAFTLWDDGVLTAWNAYVPFNYAPVAGCGVGVANWSTSATPQNNLDMDYMAYFLKPRNR